MIGFVWAVTGILASIFIGLLCMPFACLFTFCRWARWFTESSAG